MTGTSATGYCRCRIDYLRTASGSRFACTISRPPVARLRSQWAARWFAGREQECSLWRHHKASNGNSDPFPGGGHNGSVCRHRDASSVATACSTLAAYSWWHHWSRQCASPIPVHRNHATSLCGRGVHVQIPGRGGRRVNLHVTLLARLRDREAGLGVQPQPLQPMAAGRGEPTAWCAEQGAQHRAEATGRPSGRQRLGGDSPRPAVRAGRRELHNVRRCSRPPGDARQGRCCSGPLGPQRPSKPAL